MSSPHDTEGYLEEFLETLPVHKPDLIIKHARELLALNPRNLMGWAYLLQAYLHKDQLDAMYEGCKQLLAFYPGHPLAYDFLQKSYFHRATGNNYFYALQVLWKAFSIAPLNDRFLRQVAEIYLINWEPDKASYYLQQALSVDPQPEYMSRLALAELRCHRVKNALGLARDALGLDPLCEHNAINAGMVFLYSGELDEAENLFRRALGEFPNYSYVQKQLEACSREKKDRASRQSQGKRYTPLYKRQRGTKKHFDEDAPDALAAYWENWQQKINNGETLPPGLNTDPPWTLFMNLPQRQVRPKQEEDNQKASPSWPIIPLRSTGPFSFGCSKAVIEEVLGPLTKSSSGDHSSYLYTPLGLELIFDLKSDLSWIEVQRTSPIDMVVEDVSISEAFRLKDRREITEWVYRHFPKAQQFSNAIVLYEMGLMLMVSDDEVSSISISRDPFRA